jgi:hypothetical protein
MYYFTPCYFKGKNHLTGKGIQKVFKFASVAETLEVGPVVPRAFIITTEMVKTLDIFRNNIRFCCVTKITHIGQQWQLKAQNSQQPLNLLYEFPPNQSNDLVSYANLTNSAMWFKL